MNPSRSNWRERLAPILFLSSNWISRTGVGLVTSVAVFWLFLLPIYLRGEAASAYLGILLFLLLPAGFFIGLALIPLGILLFRKRLRRQQEPGPQALPPLDWRHPGLRRLVAFIGLVTAANVVIGGNLSYRAVSYMDSVQFCGSSCHVVMKPQYTAYQHSPHSRVECVKCHIGPGASWFVQSKLSGVGQIFAVAFNSYPRPIPTPVENLRPARETCETCHWPDKYGPDRLRVITHFNDEGRASKTVLLMHIGGGAVAGKGIHTAHVGQGVRVRYAHADRARQQIPWIEYSRNGNTVEFWAPGAKKQELANWQVREMDCMDCHNRPSHTFETPERALDAAMLSGDVAPDLPGIRAVGLQALKRNYSSTEEAERELPAMVLRDYRAKQPAVSTARAADVTRSAKAILAIWQRNVFPEMKVTWGTYTNNIGHTDFPGCFRCHDAEHRSENGKAIEQDCNSCHVLLAMEEEDPKVLKDLGL